MHRHLLLIPFVAVVCSASVRPADVSPTPLLRLLNSSVVASLEQQLAAANASSLVSNISLSDLQNDNDTRHLQIRYRERKKQERLFLIQAQILQRLRIARKPNVTSPVFSRHERRRMSQLFERVRHLHVPIHGNELYAERFQSFYPSCGTPNGTERSLWESSDSFRLFYDINFPRYPEGTETTIISGKLRLYKFHAQEIMPNCIECSSSSSVPESYPRFLLPTASPAAIIVSVYQFIKPLRPHRREKKRLVDSKSVPVDLQGWIEFNLAPTINHWMQHRHKNYGLDIEVEDVFGNKQNVNLYFRNMNCTEQSAQESPFPNLMDIHPEINESAMFDNETYPTLDLQTAEFTRDITTEAPTVDTRLIRKRHAGLLYLSPLWKRTCRREEIFLTFKDLGLEEIILEPEGFHLAYCAGGCHGRKKRIACVADDFIPIDVIYVDSDGVAQEVTLNDLSAKNCVCVKL